jgi:hypothetical protein
MKLSIFHFSDSHWVPTWADPATKTIFRPTVAQTEFYQRYISDFDSLDLTPYYGDKTLLVHTGDFANFYDRKDKRPLAPIKAQFQDIRKRHLSTFESKFKNVDGRLVVPGNHDMDLDAPETKRFRDFEYTFRNWATPFSNPVVRYAIPGLEGKDIAIFLFNSASTSEKDGQRVAIANVPDKDMTDPDPADYFRIAVLHHNLLPHYGQAQRPGRDIFTNNGEFNRYLGDNNFKLVLSGHQHLGNEMFFAVPGTLPGTDFARPTLESVFLSLAAPSFLRTEYVTLLGFNLVQIELLNDSNFATVRLTKFRYDREYNPRRFIGTPGPVFQILLPRIGDLRLTPAEQTRRIRTARKVVDRFYDRLFDITQIEQITPPFAKTGHFERVRKSLELCQQVPNNIAAMYSVAVLNPSFWWQAESVFRRLSVENLARAASRNSTPRTTPTFLFRFSKPLLQAIKTSRSNGRVLSVAANLRGREGELGPGGAFGLNANPSNSGSVSTWEVDDYKTGEKSLTRRILLEPTNQEISYRLSNWTKGRSPDTLEIARIAIWPATFFDSDAACRVIQFHEDCLVPLFWLDPERLVSRPDKNGKRVQRASWGYILIYARKYRDLPGGEVFVKRRRPLTFINDKEGLVPTHASERPGSPDAYDTDLWGSGAPAHYRKNNLYLAAEFSALLRRPDIMFAIDAYGMHRAGLLAEVRTIFDRKHGDRDKWLNE